MSGVLNIARYLPKQLAILLAVFAAVLSTATAIAAADVIIEGNLQVRNSTDGQHAYQDSTTATYNEVVEFRVYYHNTELPSSQKVAENLSVKVDFPTNQGRDHVVTATIKGDNTNTVVETATVNVNRPDAILEFIPGSVMWEHNVGDRNSIVYDTVQLSDDVVTSGEYVVIEDEQPCHEYEAWITFKANVKVPAAEIEKTVSVNDEPWTESVNAEPGSIVKYLLTVKNTGNTTLENVGVRDLLPENQTLVEGTTKLVNSNHPAGIVLSDNIVTENGLNIGDIAAGATVYVGFRVEIAPVEDLECGTNPMINTGQVVSDLFTGDSDTAEVNVNKTCEEPEDPVYECDVLATIIDMDARKVKAEIKVTKSDDVTVTGYSIDFGDDKVVNEQSASHTYAKDGTYNIVGTVTFDVNGESKTATCKDSLKIDVDTPMCEIDGKGNLAKDDPNCKEDEKPEVLPNTGAGGFLTVLFGTGTTTAAIRSWMASRRALKRDLLEV